MCMRHDKDKVCQLGIPEGAYSSIYVYKIYVTERERAQKLRIEMIQKMVEQKTKFVSQSPVN